jgi:ribose 5-phosphate isomerase B
MTRLDESEIHKIVENVLQQTLGTVNQPVTSSVPATKENPATTSSPKKIVVIGSDHGGYELKEILKPEIITQGFEVVDVGTKNKDAVDYPDYAHQVARMVIAGKAWRGIMIDGAGVGSCIVANKVPGIRAGMAYDYSSAVNSREHNDTNVLTLGAGLIGVNLAKLIVKTWLSTEFGGSRHTRRIEKIIAVEKQYLK